MLDVIEVMIGNDIKLCSPDKYVLKKGVSIIVKTDKGYDYAIVRKPNFRIKAHDIVEPLLTIARIANKNDFKTYKRNNSDSKKAFSKCDELIKKYKLNMSLIDARYSFDRKQLNFHFVSDERVDFRKLAKDLANLYKTRIELRQIGVRDKAQLVGGCGQCGRELCCRGFLKNFNTVSINMVKNQNLSLNPSKINGVCGRLMCCMKYEDTCYNECRKGLPSIGKIVETDKGKGKVVSLDILKGEYRVDVEDYGILECSINGSNQ